MLTLAISITRDDEEGTFTVRCGNVASEEGDIEKTCADKQAVKEAVGDIAWLALTNFEAEEARRAKAHEDHVAEFGEDATTEQPGMTDEPHFTEE